MVPLEMARARNGSEGRDAAEPRHDPVLLESVLGLLEQHDVLAGDGWIVDGTVGLGGHARAVLERFPGARLLGLDQDPQALELARRELASFGDRVRLARGRLSQLDELLAAQGVESPVAALFDLGASSLQLDLAERGFSFQADGPLDMRMDPDRERTAADVVNRWDESDLADLLYFEGDERHARRVAAAIVEARRRAPFLRTAALADLVERALGGRGAGGRIHPATRTFQALRRAVNEEGEELQAGLAWAERSLADGGLLQVLTFHSGEDRAVKRFLAEGAIEGRWDLVTRKPLRAGEDELRANRRARSAGLRAAVRTRGPDESSDEESAA